MPGKITAFFALALALLLIAGCGGQKAPAEKTGETSPEITKETITKEKAAGARFGPPAPGPQPGEKAPSFKLPELNSNKKVAFPEDFQGKKVALLFFSGG
ncbi:MAG: hypothetical protein AB1523_08200 [Bacillota bacterium]